jgi:hypothetical protein
MIFKTTGRQVEVDTECGFLVRLPGDAAAERSAGARTGRINSGGIK